MMPSRQLSRYYPYLFFAAISALILGPLWAPGYILTFDMSWTPHVRAPFAVFTHLIPSWMLQKLLVFSILMLAAVGAYRLGRQAGLSGTPTYLAGLVYVMNPFIYTRFMAGQFLVLLGYALLPYVAAAVWRLLERPGLRTIVLAAAWATALSLASVHSIGLAAVLSATLVVAWGWGRWRELRSVATWLAGAAMLWLIGNALWLGPLLVGNSSLSRQIASFDQAQAEAFATASGRVGGPLNVAVLQGFWGDPIGRYVLPEATGLLFWLAAGLLLGLVGLGVARAWRRSDRLGLALAAAGFIGWVLAIGLASPPTAALTSWLMDYLPFYQGYREPQKWAALLALAYACLAAGGAAWLLERLRPAAREAAGLALMLVPLIGTPMMLWGFGGQLRSTDYPPGWYELDRQLRAENPSARTLMLPWHQYLPLDFAGRVVANPASGFFTVPVVSSANPELPGVPPGPDASGLTRRIEDGVLAHRFVDSAAAPRLAGLGIKRVVLLKQADWQTYDWLSRQPGLVLVRETPDYQLWRVEGGRE
jgi:hypothetical protein